MKKSRDYQLEGHDAVMQALEAGEEDQLLVMATGMGKTHVACTIKNEPVFQKTLWLTHKEELIDQSALALLGVTVGHQYDDAIRKEGGYIPFLDKIHKGSMFGEIGYMEGLQIRNEIGVVKEKRLDKDSKTIVASVQTMINRLHHFEPDEFDLVIADECHYAMAKSWVKILEYFRPRLRLGLTATPWRMDGASLSTMFGKIVYERDIKYGIDNGWLVEIDCERIKTGLSLDTVGRQGGEFKTGELERLVNNPLRNKLIVEKYKQYADGKQTLVFAVDVRHCIDLYEAFIDAGVAATFVVGDKELCPDRRERFRKFKSGEVQVLVNVDIATTGFDHDMVECLIMARPTMSLSLYLQMTGRGTRTERGVIDGLETAEERIAAIRNSRKKYLLILDITDNTTKHNLVNSWTLDEDKKEEDKIFQTKETTAKQIALFAEERKRKLKHHQKEDQRVDLLKLPKLKLYQSGRYLEAATEKQLAIIKRQGYEIENTYYTKYDASMIISNLPAYDWQVKQVKEWGYDVSKGVTAGQYGMIKSEMEQKKQITSSHYNEELKKFISLPFTGME